MIMNADDNAAVGHSFSLSCKIDLSKLVHGFLYIVTWICDNDDEWRSLVGLHAAAGHSFSLSC